VPRVALDKAGAETRIASPNDDRVAAGISPTFGCTPPVEVSLKVTGRDRQYFDRSLLDWFASSQSFATTSRRR
jgi:hypothetical protein